MNQIIEKGCHNINNYRMKIGFYERARDAFGAVLDKAGIQTGDKILMPAYIGWSCREGSGVFDPVKNRNINPIFYHLDSSLNIDINDLEIKMKSEKVKAILIIHYFGFVDRNIAEIIKLARANEVLVIEDAAHAFFSDFAGGSCGKIGDYTLYSLHKMFPMGCGGMLLANNETALPEDSSQECRYGNPFFYNINKIASKRIENYNEILKYLPDNSDLIKPIYSLLPQGIIPQTFPVLLPGSNRDEVYKRMNDMGWGVVSLYHTMISEIDRESYEREYKVSRSILNLPVHQDIQRSLIENMMNDLQILVDELRY